MNVRRILVFAITGVVFAGCAGAGMPGPAQAPPKPKICHFVYDAGSTGTSLYIFQEGIWRQDYESPEKDGDKKRVLANLDNDGIALTIELLDRIKTVFDWESKENCDRIASISVFATAGMRLAEQEKLAESRVYWKDLKNALQARFPNVPVSARTITGFEEGLYVWLTVSTIPEVVSENFGVAGMGGSSAQVVFPCPPDKCNTAQPISIDGKTKYFYSYSFLGIGGKHIPMSLVQHLPQNRIDNGVPKSCKHGGGTPDNCENDLKQYVGSSGIADPYNLNSAGKTGTVVQVPVNKVILDNWYLNGGGFKFWEKDHIDKCCTRGIKKRPCDYLTNASCGRAVYVDLYLDALGIAKSKDKTFKISWAKGAAICIANGCLRYVNSPIVGCQWLSKTECLPSIYSGSNSVNSFGTGSNETLP